MPFAKNVMCYAQKLWLSIKIRGRIPSPSPSQLSIFKCSIRKNGCAYNVCVLVCVRARLRLAFVNVIYFCSVALILPTWVNRQEEVCKKWGEFPVRNQKERREKKHSHTHTHITLRPTSAWHEKPKCTPRKIVNINAEIYSKYKTFRTMIW